MGNLYLKRAFSCTLSVISTASIFLNPLIFGKQSQYKTKMFTNGLNEILHSVGLTVKFEPYDVVNIILFCEFFILGMILVGTTKVFFENFLKHITIPLFIGLSVSVMTVYYGYITTNSLFQIKNVLFMFRDLSLGIILYLILYGIFFRRRDKNSNHRFKYKGR